MTGEGELVRDAWQAVTDDGGWRFTLLTRPAEGPAGGVLMVPGFAEELNRCRRQAALAATRFAAEGWWVLQFDLLGTGDSSGDFSDATWDAWQDDVERAHRWLAAELPAGRPIVLLTVRAGALLAASWLERSGVELPWLLWQPLPRGRQVLGNFLRLVAAAGMLDGVQAARASQRVREDLQEGRTARVAGYSLSARLAHDLETAELEVPDGYGEPIAMLEVVTSAARGPSPAIQATARACRERGARCRAAAVEGPRFWQTQEVEVAPALIDESTRFLLELGRA